MKRILLLWILSAPAVWAQPLFFIQMSDPQFGMYQDNRGFDHETANFQFAIASANRLKPAFVVVTGDLINRPGDPVEADEYRRVAGLLDPSIPLYNVPGNHDVGNDPTPETLADYRERFGPDYYTFRAGTLEGFVLDSALLAHPQKAPQEASKQEAWLRAELQKTRQSDAKQLVVFLHHSLFLHDPAEKDDYFNVPLEIRKRYLELFREYHVLHVFAGHYHRNAEARDGDLEMITTGPVGKPLGDARSGFRVVTVGDGVFRNHYYDFGLIPDQIPTK